MTSAGIRPGQRLVTAFQPVALAVVVLQLTCLGDVLPGARAQGGGQSAERGVPVRPVPPAPACGTKFVDASSSALLADVVLKGSVLDLRQANPLAPLLYKAEVNVHKVYKGRDLLTSAASGRSNANSSSSSSIVRKQSGADVVHVERFGPAENRENCVGHVEEGHAYLFFLRVKDSSSASLSSSSSSSLQRSRNNEALADSPFRSPAVLVNTALPVGVDPKTLRKVKKVLCPDCSSVPVIRKLRCKHCAVKPSMKRAMGTNNTKTVKTGRRLALRCVARGSPAPSYTWVKDGVILYHQEKTQDPVNEEEMDAGRGRRRRRRERERSEAQGEGEGEGSGVFKSGTLSVRNSKHHSLLVVRKVTPQDQGTYLCLAANAVGEAEQRVQVRVRASSRSRSRSRSRLSSDLDPLSSSPREGDEHAVVDDSDEDDDDDDDDDDGEDPCAVNPCHNGGTCLVAEDGEAAAGRRARCHCLPDYHGSRCQFQRRPRLLDAAAAGDLGHTQSSTSTTVSPNDVNNNNNNDNDFDNINNNLHVGAAAVPPKPTLLYPLITTSDTANGPIFLTPQSLQPRPSSSSPLHHHHHHHHDQRNTYLRKKHRRKYATPSGGVSYGIRANKASGSGAPQLKVKDCPPRDAYCLNGGTCKLVVRLQRRFCQCPRGFAGRRCEQRV